jgi:hypothetical protein
MYKSLDTVYLQSVFGLLNEAAKIKSPGVEAAKQVKKPKVSTVIDKGLKNKQQAPEPVADIAPIVEPKKPATKTKSFDELIESFFPTPEDKKRLHSVKGILLPTGGSIQIEHIDKKDLSVWQEIFNQTPLKKDSDEQTRGSGNGELAVYWFLKKGYENQGIEVKDNRSAETGSPDLLVGNTGVEVKSYPFEDKFIGLGRFKSAGKRIGYNNNIVISTVLGLNALMKKIAVLDEASQEKFKRQKKIADSANFRYEDFEDAFKKVDSLYKIVNVDSALLNEFEVFKQLKSNIEEVYGILGNEAKGNTSPEDNTKQLMYRILRAKLGDKPGYGGYIANALKDGRIEWLHVPAQLKDIKKFPNGFTGHEVFATGSMMHVNKNIFK